MSKRTLLSWSSGKDSAWALAILRARGEHDVVGLLTTVNRAAERVAMHGVRIELLRAQAEAAGLPLCEVAIPASCSNAEYEAAMGEAMARAKAEGVQAIAFGDLFLEDIRHYREAKLAGTGIEPVFPLWGEPTDRLARTMIAGGLRARITCVDSKQLDVRFCGRELDETLLAELPPNVDPCGERGEFHTFAFAGPMFSHPIEVQVGRTLVRDGFAFTDLLPEDVPFPTSLCHACAAPPKYVRSARSCFILCPLTAKKYPPQPVVQCALYRPPT